ncbi:jg14383, partial [Pararge aegeria aegeria]
MNDMVKLWRESISSTNKKSGQSLADPEKYENLFPEYAESLELEKMQRQVILSSQSCLNNIPINYKKCNIKRDLVEELTELNGVCKMEPNVVNESAKNEETKTGESLPIVPQSEKKRKDSLDSMEEIDREINEMVLDGEEL